MDVYAEPPFQPVTWIVKDFLELPQHRGFFLDSPEFLFSGDRYCLRLFPNGKDTFTRKDTIKWHVRRLNVTFPERKVFCKIGFRTREEDGEECYHYTRYSLEKNYCYPRYLIEGNRDKYVPGGNLTVVCKLWLSEESGAGSSDRGEEEQGGIPGHSASFSPLWSSPKMDLITEFPCTLVSLIVPYVSELLGDRGGSLTSPEFRFAGDTYCFQFRPNGATADIDLELVRLTSAFTENTVFYRVGYWSGVDSPTYPNNSRPLVGSRGFCLSRSKLEKERDKYARDDTLSLFLFLYLGERSSAGAGTSDVARERTGLTDIEKLQSNFRELLKNETESDACFVVRGKEFPVHRNVLRARSAVFEAMFGHDTAEKESGRVVVDDLDPDTFGDVIEYLYTGDVETGLSEDNVFGLYAAADKYDLSTLKSTCVRHMRQTLTVDSLCDVVALALRHHEEDLLQLSIEFFKNNLQRIFTSAKWQQFNVDNAASVNEFLSKAYSPETQ